MLREKRLRVGEAPRSNLDTYTVSKEPKKKQYKVQYFKIVEEEKEDLYVLNVLPVWLVLEFGFTEL